jgi:hypothetical protein
MRSRRLCKLTATTHWVVYAKKPFRRPDHVLRYLGRYTHRVAISSSRLVTVTGDAVTFHTKRGNKASLHPVEFLRRFVQHVLPQGFHKIRHLGLYAGAAVAGALSTARATLAPAALSAPESAARSTWRERLRALTGHDVDRCRVCGGPVDHIPLLAPPSRSKAPPVRAA